MADSQQRWRWIGGSAIFILHAVVCFELGRHLARRRRYQPQAEKDNGQHRPKLSSRQRKARSAAAKAAATPVAEARFESCPSVEQVEKVLAQRTDRLVVVVEGSCDARNEAAIIRAADVLGVQYVCIIADPAGLKNLEFAEGIVAGADRYVTVRHFADIDECVAELRRAGYQLWATDLSPEAECISELKSPLPEKIALILGREADGISKPLLEQADRRMYLQLRGFTESLNVAVAGALCVDSLLQLMPDCRGLPEAIREDLRQEWLGDAAVQRLRLTDVEKDPAFDAYEWHTHVATGMLNGS